MMSIANLELSAFRTAVKLVRRELLVTQDQILSKCRKSRLSLARHLCIWMLHKGAFIDLNRIAEMMNMNISTVAHAVKNVDDKCDVYPKFKEAAHLLLDEFKRRMPKSLSTKTQINLIIIYDRRHLLAKTAQKTQDQPGTMAQNQCAGHKPDSKRNQGAQFVDDTRNGVRDVSVVAKKQARALLRRNLFA